jgi:hypothetical protein
MSPAEFLSIIKVLPKTQAGFPSKKAIAAATGLNVYTVKTMLGGLVKNGKLRMEGNWYKFNEEMLLEKYDKAFSNDVVDKTIKDHFKIDNGFPIEITDEQAKDYMDHITEENKHDSIEAPSIMLNKISIKPDNAFTILRYLLLIIGSGAMIMSAYYTQIWLNENLNTFLSWFLSILMISFSSIAFLTLIALIKGSISRHWSRWIIALLFFILWIITTIFSISSTIAGQYNRYMTIRNNISIEQTENTLLQNKLVLLKENRFDAETRRNDLRKRLNTLLLQADTIQLGIEVKGETWMSIQSRILSTNEIIKELDSKIEQYRIDEVKILERSPIISNETTYAFYTWIAKVFSKDKEMIQFWMMIFPSLFLDILSPAALSVFMFLGKKKEE